MDFTTQRTLSRPFSAVKSAGDIPEAERPAVRNDLDQVLSELKTASEAKGISREDKETAKSTHDLTMKSVQYAPWWVPHPQRRLPRAWHDGRIQAHCDHALASAWANRNSCRRRGIGGAGRGRSHRRRAVSQAFQSAPRMWLRGGISGTMVGSGAGLQPATAWQIATAWVLTLPATIVLSGGLFYLLS